MTQLSPSLWVYHGEVNVGVVTDRDQALLFGFGLGEVQEALAAQGVRRVARVLLTHYHRDEVGALAYGAAPEAAVVAPAAERDLLENPAAYWDNPYYRWRTFSQLARYLVPAQPTALTEVCRPGDRFTWGPATITVLDTPGHTEGSVSYLVEVEGRRVIFSGDVIAGPGQVWELFSLQRGGAPLANGERLAEYHGYLGAREALLGSLATLRAVEAEVLVPSHGVLLADPAAALDLLASRLQESYRQYASTSAVRYYFPEVLPADGPRPLATAQTFSPPEFLTQVFTSWLLRSEDGGVFVMDCGSQEAVTHLQSLRAQGAIRGVEGLWITHYHNDHTDGCEELLAAFPCPVYADAAVAEVITRPQAYQLPCLSSVPVPVTRATAHGETWRWREFTLTAYHLPGQTHHHGGLLVEGRGQRLFFAGDSVTPTGIDDYCLANRMPVGAGRGFDFCLRLLRELQPDLIFNAHVPEGFRFTDDQYEDLLATLAARERACAALLPWDQPSYGLDPYWVRAYPYEQRAQPGEQVALELRITNHSDRPQDVAASLRLPTGWGEPPSAQHATLPARSDGSLHFTLDVPVEAAEGRAIVLFAIRHGDRDLGWAAEAVFEVSRANDG